MSKPDFWAIDRATVLEGRQVSDADAAFLAALAKSQNRASQQDLAAMNAQMANAARAQQAALQSSPPPAVPTESPEVSRLKADLARAEQWAEEMTDRWRAACNEGEDAWRRRLEPHPQLPGVRLHIARDEVVISGRAWKAWQSGTSQREQHLADECGQLRQRVKDAERERDAAQAEVYRLTKGKR